MESKILNEKKSTNISVGPVTVNRDNDPKTSTSVSPTETTKNKTPIHNDKHIVFAQGNLFTKPILMIETYSPAEELAKLNLTLNAIIDEGKQNGKLHSASFYLRDLDNENWIEGNETEGYYPGSLMKLAVLICYLKKSEAHPEILEKTLTLKKNLPVPGQTYKDAVIKAGIPYKISDLLYQMAVRSDNFATLLLNEELDINELNSLFAILGLKKMDMLNITYTITTKDYSKFMRVLYNATYLNINNSQLALSMLSNSSFNRGLTRNLPKNVVVAHKFGENVSGKVRQLHESGIVYTGTHTYLLTVMTKGERVNDLADVISNISARTYNYFMP